MMIQRTRLDYIIKEVCSLRDSVVIGKICAIKGLLIEATGLEHHAALGSVCFIGKRDVNIEEVARLMIDGVGDASKKSLSGIFAEVIGFNHKKTLLMPFGNMIGIGVGYDIILLSSDSAIYPDKSWIGRVINAFAQPIDELEAINKGEVAYYLHNNPPPANQRRRIKEKLNLGVRAINTFLTCSKGQRMCVISGSGIGKSTLLSMIAKFTSADVKIIGLIGERGREVQDFIHDYLGKNGMAQSIVVVATSDEPALIRKQAAYLTMTIAEYFRDIGMNVLCIIDSLTRFAMAQREIGLCAGEPPTMMGYTPSVFAEMPKLLERAGPGIDGQGDITGLFSVLVERDDTNDVIADIVRSIVDGHIILRRDIAAMGIYPAIDVMHSISRTRRKCSSDREIAIVERAKRLLSTYNDMIDMVRIGAYKAGTDKNIDDAVKYAPFIHRFITQKEGDCDDIETSYEKLANIIDFNRT